MYRITSLLCIVFLASFLVQSTAFSQESAGAGRLAPRARADLDVPPELWNRILNGVGHSGRLLGYDVDAMHHFKGSTCILRNVEMLFRDVKSIPQFTGSVSQEFLAAGENFASTTFTSWRILDGYAARLLSYEPLGDWNVDWISEGASADEVFQLIGGADAGRQALLEWSKLPPEIKKLVCWVVIAAVENTPWLHEAFDEGLLGRYFGVASLSEVSGDQFYAFASAPWQEEDEETMGQPTPRESFVALDSFDRRYFATGSNLFFTTVYGAVREYQLSVADHDIEWGDFNRCEFNSVMGKVGIFGDGADTIQGDYSLIVDLGGDDNYAGATAVPRSFDKPIGIVIDLGGNDTYDSGELRASLACGNHGIGAILDLSGDDRYVCGESGIASAWYGTGLVVDYEGNDSYESRIWSQGAAHAGVGMLMDLRGNDRYSCIEQSQAFGSTYGMGVLIDIEGNDVYFADPEGHISELFEGRTCNLSQGMGFGRRADFGDGHSLGGGIGMLVEGGGDDSYTGSVYVQGSGYWWALGALEDRGGNDVYRCEQYSLGSAPHFAIGCCVDLTGDDNYNVGYEDVERQIQGHARDASIAVFIDGSGNDQYWLPNLAAGASDLNCITLFWDRLGDDIYTADRNPPSPEAYSFGHVTPYERFNTFRDTMACVGIFLDTAGTDTYKERPPLEPADIELKPIPFAENSEWRQRSDPYFWGFGLDIQWYDGLEEEVPEEE